MSIVAIAAQAGGGALGIDTTTLVAFNKSIRDRIIPIKDSPITPSTKPPGAAEIAAKIVTLKESLKILYTLGTNLKTGWFSDRGYDVDGKNKYQNALKDIISFFVELGKPKMKGKAILPTVLNIDMDGIGGIIIGNLFKTNTDILPKGYKNMGEGVKLGYLVTEIGHSLQGNDWVTKLAAQTIILEEPQGEGINFNDIVVTNEETEETTDKSKTKTIILGPDGKPKPKPKLKGGKNDDAIIKKYGEIGDASQLTTMTFPYPMYYDGTLVKTARCHKLVKNDLEAIFKEILTTFGLKKIKELKLDQYSGLYNVRNKRGGSTPSIHSWAIAIDLYAAGNGLKVKTGDAVFSKPEYKTFIDIWYKHNFKSFGRELDYDWMHFQVNDAHF